MLDVTVEHIENTYGNYVLYGSPVSGSLATCCAKLKEAIRELSVMRSFKGDAADSIKAYFAEFHGSIINNLICCAGQLQSDFAQYYLSRYTNNPLNECSNARLVEEELCNIYSELKSSACVSISEISSLLGRMSFAQSSQLGIDVPSTSKVDQQFSELICNVANTKNLFQEIEQSGASAFQHSSSLYSSLVKAVSDELNVQMGDLSSYKPGAFAATNEALMAKTAFVKAVLNQRSVRSHVVDITQQCLDRTQAVLEKNLASSEKMFTFFSCIDGVAKVMAAMSGACAVVARITDVPKPLSSPKQKDVHKVLSGVSAVVSYFSKGVNSINGYGKKLRNEALQDNREQFATIAQRREAEALDPYYFELGAP